MANAIEIVAENRIVEAQAGGAFDGLAGRGRPLRLDDDAGVPADWRATFRLLRAAGFAPAWIEIAREIQDEIERLHGALADVAASKDGGSNGEARYAARVAQLNGRIARFNLLAPGPRWQIPPLPMEVDRNETGLHGSDRSSGAA